MNNFEILIRKKNAAYVYNLVLKLNMPIEHEHFKKIVYDEEVCKSSLDQYIKRIYVSYTYLLLNTRSMLNIEIISKYHYLLIGKVIDENVALQVVSAFYKPFNNNLLRRCINFLQQLLVIFNDLSYNEKYIISASLFNYSLAYYNLEMVSEIDINYYETNTYEEIEHEYLKQVNRETRQPKSYYRDLKKITKKDIINVFERDREIFHNKYHIKTLILFGSFARDQQRIDSDIDLFVEFYDGMSYNQKKDIINLIKEQYYNELQRHIDIIELTNLILDCYIKKLQDYYLIFGGENE
ncbi:MAG: nucleotidyltransferase family protein [Bacilli bacterium]